MSQEKIRVKMCGMTRREDIDYAIHLGADAFGLIFYEKSKRFVTIQQAKQLLSSLPPFIDAVAVFVNANSDIVQQVINELPIQYLQFHGDESPEYCLQFKMPYIKSIQPRDANQIHRAIKEYSQARSILLDTPSLDWGGTGQSFDWSIIPDSLAKPFILAGGLDEFNVQEAIKMCAPFAVDVCSGIEVTPGIKDHSKMSRFIKSIWGTP